MKKLLLFTFITSLLSMQQNVYSQVPEGTLLEEDIVFTDLDGVEHSLFSYLDAGKPVVLDLFAEWCGPCWNYHNTGTGHPNGGALKTLYNTYGPNGTDELMVFAIETDPSTAQSLMYGGAGTQGWDWVTGTPYPMANANIMGQFEQSYFPYIVMVCPNRQVFELGQNSANVIKNQTENCLMASGSNSAGLLELRSEEILCEESDVVVRLQNLGFDILTEATIELSQGGSSVFSFDWSGDLETYEAVDVAIGSLSPQPTPTATVIAITSPSENTDALTLDATFSLAGEIGPGVLVEIETDNYGAETYWRILNGNGVKVAEGGNPNVENNYDNGLENVPSHPDMYGNASDYEHEVMLDEGDCYTFEIFDYYGDGICCSYGLGSYTVRALSDNSIILSGGEFDGMDAGKFQNMAVSVSEQDLKQNLSIFPNPVVNAATVQTVLRESANISIEVFDLTGKVVYSEELGTQPAGEFMRQIDFNSMSNGMYLLNLKVGEASVTRKLSVNK